MGSGYWRLNHGQWNSEVEEIPKQDVKLSWGNTVGSEREKFSSHGSRPFKDSDSSTLLVTDHVPLALGLFRLFLSLHKFPDFIREIRSPFAQGTFAKDSPTTD